VKDAAKHPRPIQLFLSCVLGDLLRTGSETPSRTSWSHFFVKDAAKHPQYLKSLPTYVFGYLLYATAGSETPSRTSWSHFFVKDAAKHPLVAAAEGQIETLFGCPALRGPHKPLAKIETLQGGPSSALYILMKGHTLLMMCNTGMLLFWHLWLVYRHAKIQLKYEA
jgi:hypothetical protein